MMFEILMYLFENYMDGSVKLLYDQDTIMAHLEQVGFHATEIGQAMDWLESLSRLQEGPELLPLSATSGAMRHYLPDELERLTVQGRGFLLFLEQIGILDARTREVVLDRLMALDQRDIDLGRIKWVVLIALFNQPDKKSALSLLQDMILSEALGAAH
jgi:Smg protein